MAHDPERQLAYVVGGLALDVLDARDGRVVRSLGFGEDRFESGEMPPAGLAAARRLPSDCAPG